MIVIIIIIIVVAAVVSSNKNNKYPDYTKLNYKIADTCAYIHYEGRELLLICVDDGESFFDNFDYFTGYDPASGLVHYVAKEQADSATYNLTYASASSAVLRVDTTVTKDTVPNADTGRFSVRISSKKQYADGLFIFDVKHTPLGCATWPALWLVDAGNWPENGEIDVMEAVNVVGDVPNQMTLHTSAGCSMKVKRKETGKSLTSNCINSTDGNAGCGVEAGTATFGKTYNDRGGGIMALELRSEGIRMWQFLRGPSIPADITAGNPDPSLWGEATADFPNTNCNIGNHFKNQSITANIDLCGYWAGAPKVYNENCTFLLSLISLKKRIANTSRSGPLPRSSSEQQHGIHRRILGIRSFSSLSSNLMCDSL